MKDNARTYFIEGFELIDYYGYCSYNTNNFSIQFIFYYFWQNKEYRKCEAILLMLYKLLEKNQAKQFILNDVLIFSLELNISQGKTLEAEQSLIKLEKNIKLDEVLLNPQRYIKIHSLMDITHCYKISEAYLKLKNYDFVKVEKILKYCEEVLNARFATIWGSKASVYLIFGYLYLDQKKYKLSKVYYEKTLDLTKHNNLNAFNVEDLYFFLAEVDRLEKLQN